MTIDNCNLRQRLLVLALIWICRLNGLAAEPPSATTAIAKPIQLFNGRDFDGWYVYTTETKHDNPGVFQVVDSMIYVPGGKTEVAYFGGLITRESYENYRLRFEFKWGEHTYGRRKDKARDAGVMVHCIGANGPGPWMTSYEFQIIEGGTGDLLIVNPLKVNEAGLPFTLTCRADAERQGMEWYFKKGAKSNGLKEGERLNWWGRDPQWKDVAGFRGPSDVESPIGQWTRCEIVARGATLEYYVNDKLVNCASDLNVSRGKILLQTEGAEVWYRNIELAKLLN